MSVKNFYFISYTSNILYAFLDLGTGWNVARINDIQVDWFTEQVHLPSYDQRAYWVAGMSNQNPGSFVGHSGLSDKGKTINKINYKTVLYIEMLQFGRVEIDKHIS